MDSIRRGCFDPTQTSRHNLQMKCFSHLTYPQLFEALIKFNDVGWLSDCFVANTCWGTLYVGLSQGTVLSVAVGLRILQHTPQQ